MKPEFSNTSKTLSQPALSAIQIAVDFAKLPVAVSDLNTAQAQNEVNDPKIFDDLKDIKVNRAEITGTLR